MATSITALNHTALAAQANGTAAPKRGTFHPFSRVPVADSCWSLSTGPDGRIYAAACTEMVGGVGVYIVRYNQQQDRLDYLLDVAKAVGDPADSGRATQCKIHYCFNPSPSTGILYMATHLSGAPINEFYYSALSDMRHPRRGFRGSALLAYDTRHDRVLWHDILIPGEGARCTCLDDERGLLYVLSYPRDHFYVYDLKTRTLRDKGRIGSVNSQAIFLDARGRAYTANQYGQLLRYDPETDQLTELKAFLPAASYQNGWHSVIYDIVASPEGDCFYGITWNVQPQLFRYWPDEGPDGLVENLGSVTQERDRTMAVSMFLDHAGGLVFDAEGYLYYVISRWRPGEETRMLSARDMRDIENHAIVMRLDVNTGAREEFARLERSEGTTCYVSRGARDAQGDLYFGMVGPLPVGLYKLPMDAAPAPGQAPSPLRAWG